MARAKTSFECQSCGHRTPKWLGRCPECDSWESFVEEPQAPAAPRRGAISTDTKPLRIGEIPAATEGRRPTAIGELDRVLGGGLVSGSAVLVGGDPGIGKSTLVLQATAEVARTGARVLYVSGEESREQIRMRAERLGVADEDVWVHCETSLEGILAQARKLEPELLVVDSIQTVATEEITSAPGSVGQVRESAARLVTYAKASGTATILVGHVTKDGAIAGPRVLEHMVDTVLYFEGERGHPFRILRAVKNRFGSTNEIGVFEMMAAGLIPVANPSELFLAERPVGVAGSVVIASMEGTRPILVELQALVTPTAYAAPRRTTLGVDSSRVALLVAVIEKKVGLQLTGQDIFLNVAGGFRIDEPAVDLGIVAAVASSFLDRAVDPGTLVIGEVGLAGEVRAVGHVEARIREAAKMGFRRAIFPESAKRQVRDAPGIEQVGIRSLEQLWQLLFE